MDEYTKGKLKRTQKSIKKGTKFKNALLLLKERGITHLVTESDDSDVEYNVMSVDKFIKEIDSYLEELENTEMRIMTRESLKQRAGSK